MAKRARPSTKTASRLKTATEPFAFISHCVDDKQFVFAVCQLLDPYLLAGGTIFKFEDHPSLDSDFRKTIVRSLQRSTLILIFVGRRFDDYMKLEAMLANALDRKLVCVVNISGSEALPDRVRSLVESRHYLTTYSPHVPGDTVRCAKDILNKLHCEKRGSPRHRKLAGMSFEWDDKHWRHGLPISSDIFEYEKEMIGFYLAKRCYEMIDQGADPDQLQEMHRRHGAILKKWDRHKIKVTLEKGIAADWPSVYRLEHPAQNPLTKDTFRGQEDESLVRANALMGLDGPGKPFTFLEAGPRPYLALPMRANLKAAIVVAGGIAPGINAVIDAIVQRHDAYRRAGGNNYNLEIIGLKNGLLAVQVPNGINGHFRRLTPSDTIEHATRGGSMLGTSRDEGLQDPNPQIRMARIDAIARTLKDENIDVLYFIGGDGSMKAAHAIWHKVNLLNVDSGGFRRMSVVAIPKTMDNDILWVWQSFGFLSAVQEAREIVERLHTEVRSNPRLGIVQFFGSGSGFVVSHAVLAAATGHTTLALIPEMDFSLIGVARYLKLRLWESAPPTAYDSADPASPIDLSIPHGLIVMGETAIPCDARECLGLAPAPPHLKPFYDEVADKVHPTSDEVMAIKDFFNNGRRVQGQTSDSLRSLGIKLLHELLPVLIRHPKLLNDPTLTPPGWEEPNWNRLRMVRNEPRYLVRALEPSTSDIITGQRLGLLAVDAAMAGYTDCMISQWLTEFTIVPLELVVPGRKRIPPTGMFWNSVTAKTRQPNDLVAPYPIDLAKVGAPA